MAVELDETIKLVERRARECEKNWKQACKDEDKAWRVNEAKPRDPGLYTDAITRRAKWHTSHLRTVGELVDQRKIRERITSAEERDQWIADAADYLKGT